MATEGISVSQGGQEGSKLERITLALVALSLVGAGACMAVDLRAGLYGPAFLLGWTQLVGL